MYHNPFVRYENTETKRMQVVFLKEHLKLSVEEISAITGYAVSTVKKYARKFLNLLKTAKKFFIQAKNSIIVPYPAFTRYSATNTTTAMAAITARKTLNVCGENIT